MLSSSIIMYRKRDVYTVFGEQLAAALGGLERVEDLRGRVVGVALVDHLGQLLEDLGVVVAISPFSSH
jgi:hypothetical protein